MSDKQDSNNPLQNSKAFRFMAIGIVLIAVILVIGTYMTGQSARRDSEDAARAVSLFYLDELAGRREEVVASNLSDKINDIYIGIELMDENNLDTEAHLREYQARMKRFYALEKFAFVGRDGTIYTSKGRQYNIDEYSFDYRNLTKPEISVKDTEGTDKTVIIAVPIDDIKFLDDTLSVCFMEINMDVLLEGVSLKSGNSETTFCNIYTPDGRALTNMVLGGLASEDNLLDALEHADYDDGHSVEKVISDFTNADEGVVSFTYNGIRETLYYKPIEGTDWLLTYLIRESVISDHIGSMSSGIVVRSVIMSVITAIVMLLMAFIMYRQLRHASQLALEKETQDAENRAKQEELEQRLELQEKILEQEKLRAQQDKMITALSADFWSVYYLDLDKDEGICYQSHEDLEDGLKVGESFNFMDAITQYANTYITEQYRDGFLEFVQPEHVRDALEKERVISYRYMVHRKGRDKYEMLRMAGVRHPEDREDHRVHAVGACITDVDRETRESLARGQALSDALTAAEEANKAKTAFLSNMSHEIRTPMNAIIGLDNIALSDDDLSDKTREYLEKIGSSARHLLGLINDILDMSRIESGRMTLRNEKFSLSRLLEQINTMISSQCSDKGIEYNCHINGSIDDYYVGDDMKLKQVIINILGNAVKFTPEGGEVDFTIERVARFDKKATIRMKMKDTGIGMSKEYLPKIFEAFSQEDSSSINKYGSSGLGLAITKTIVEMMNGNIEVDSEKGKGTTFTVTVTLGETDNITADDEQEIRLHEMSVLVIDDDPIACEHAKLVLEKVGFHAETVLSGEEAIGITEVRHARRDPFNLILVDWKMPGMDGVETTRRIRSIVGDESAVIILTAYKWDDVLEEALEAGVDSFLSKPLFASSLIDELTRALQRKNALREAVTRKADLTGRRVLMAEDVEVNAEIMTMILSMREISVDHAVNGKLAVEMFESHPEGYYDAILMDMRMPEMDGLTATTNIRSMDRSDAKTIPIIALTANAFDEDVQRSLQAGLNAHLSKPVEPETLFATLESLIKD